MTVSAPPSAPERRAELQRVWITPLVVWAALVTLLFLSLGAAYTPLGPFKTATSLAIAGIKVILIALVFMKLDRASNLVRIAALTGLVWASFLFLLAGADYLARS